MINAEYLNQPDNIYIDNTFSTMVLPELSYFDSDQYDLYDNKDYGKFIQDIERAVRMSYEYRSLINYLRNVEGMNQCSILQNVSNLESNKVKIEIHHSPLGLFDVCSTVVKKRLHNGESMDIFDCCKEVMFLHYIGYIGLVPLSATVHEMVHNSYIFIPLNIIRGAWRKFIDDYYNFIEPEVLDAIDVAEQMTQDYLNDISGVNNQVYNQNQIFNIHQTYVKFNNLDREGQIPPNRDIIKDRITEIKSQKKILCRNVDNSVRISNILEIMNSET